jgi:hypothetical protein
MPVWALALSVLLPVIYVLPTGFIYAMTGQAVRSQLHNNYFETNDPSFYRSRLTCLRKLSPGTLLPGQPIANMFFKVYSVQTLSEAASFVQDLKLGHYIKIPPRATFHGVSPSCACQDA